MKKATLLILSAILTLTCLFAEDIYGPTESGTWTKANSPYYIYGDVKVPNNQSLVIEPGVEVIFMGHYRITTSYSDLMAVGTSDSMILFTMADTNGLVAGGEDEGGWNGFRFWYSSESGDTSRLEYCRFEYAKVIDNVSGGRGVVGTERIPRLKVANCIFEYNYSIVNGVDCRLADVLIRDNIFRNNVGESVIRTSQANPYFYNNQIEDNTCTDMIRVSSWCFPVIENNTIQNNTSDFIVLASGDKSNARVLNNRITNNTITNTGANYIFKLIDSDIEVYGNLIANNNGDGILVQDGNPKIFQNTLVNNDGYPLTLETDNSEFNGNILYGNTQPVYYIKKTTEPSFFNNILQGGTAGFTNNVFSGEEENNIDVLPGFIDPTGGAGTGFDASSADFGLLPTSPAINKGDASLNEENFLKFDIYGNDRVKYSYIDIGAAEGSVSSDTIKTSTISSDQILIGDTVYIKEDLTIDDDVVLTIAGGCKLFFLGPYSIDVNGTLIADGAPTDTIWFTLRDTTGFGGSDYNAGCWKGIHIKNYGAMDDNQPSSFKHCIFEYAKTDNYNGAVFSLNSLPEFNVSHCIFRYNRSESGRTVLDASNSVINLDHISVISNSSISNGTMYFSDSEVNLSNSLFRDNTATAGIGIELYGSTLFSSHNIFHNNNIITLYNSGGVVRCTNSEVTIVNDLMVNNTSANAPVYSFSSCIGSITNTTIANNSNTNSFFAGAIGFTRTNLTITNSILYGNRSGSTNRASIMMFEENTDPDLYNCLIEDGISGIRTYSGFSFTGEYEDCIDQEPHFIDPSLTAGADEDATGRNWQLLDISPAINSGKQDTSGLNLSSVDFGGNPRIANKRVDIGAYEKEGQPAMITTGPQGGNFCTGDQIKLLVEYSQTDTVSYQWKKDGVIIPGAISDTLVIDTARLADEGNYVCILQNSFGNVNTVPVFLSVKAAPEILVEPDYSWVRPDIPLTMSVLVNGSSPLLYKWMKNGVDIPGATLPEYKFIPADSSHEGAYTCEISNICGTEVTTATDLLIAPQICMVTVDPASGKNLVVWEKKTKASIMAYNIYRETQAAGIYDILGTVAFDDLSEFTDSTADPTAQAYLYKMTAVMTDTTETDADLCKPHKTIHLLVSTNPELNTTQLEWDRYHGFNYQTYNIYRSTTGTNFDLVKSMASSLNSWTDPAPVAGDLFYRISAIKPVACYPDGGSTKAGTGPYQHALSNLDDNKLKTGDNAPDTLTLDGTSISENNAIGALVARLLTEDADTFDVHTYQFVDGSGDDDNSSFSIFGDMLLAAEAFDFEMKNSLSIRVRSTDQGGNYFENTFIISILDVDETVGIYGYEDQQVKIYPNPLNQSAWVEFPNEKGESFTMYLTDLAGKTVMVKRDILSNRFMINRKNLGRGYYMLELRGKQVYRSRILVE